MVRAVKASRTMVDPDSHIEKVVDLGFVGEPEKVDLTLLNQLIGYELIPVLAPLATSKEGQTLNVNADTFAGAVAGALKAKRLLLLTDGLFEGYSGTGNERLGEDGLLALAR